MKKTNNFNENKINLEIIRQMLGMTQEEFADALGISRRSVIRYENGQREPTFNVTQIKKFIKLIERAGFNLDDLPNSLSGTSNETEAREPIAA